VRCTRCKSGKEILHGGCGVGIVDEGGVVAERVHSEEHEIERGEGFWPAKPKIEPRGFRFALEHANPSADQRVGLWSSVGVVILVTAHCVGEIARGAGFGLQNRKPNRVGSVSVNSAVVPAGVCRGDQCGPLYAAFAVASTYKHV
jgi:hypothetical protein